MHWLYWILLLVLVLLVLSVIARSYKKLRRNEKKCERAKKRCCKPCYGVVDGSEVKSGQVGEYLEVYQDEKAITNNTVNFLSLDLSPGDWELSASAMFNGISLAYTEMYVSNDQTINYADVQYGKNGFYDAMYQNPVANHSMHVPRFRINVTTPVTYYLQLSAAGESQSVSAVLSARRIR